MSKLDMAKSIGLVSESEYGGYRAKNFAVGWSVNYSIIARYKRENNVS